MSDNGYPAGKSRSMKLLYATFIIVLIFVTTTHAQYAEEFGTLTDKELEFTTYDKDPTANAVVLYEKGDTEFKVIDNRIRLVKEYRVKIKILKEQGFDLAKVALPYYHNDNLTEQISGVKAITHNGKIRTGLKQEEIFTVALNDRLSEKRFAFPNVKIGSILEYAFTLTSPFIYNLEGWSFQSNIPKIYSEFNARIPGNYVYNRTLVGNLKLSTNDASIKKACFFLEDHIKPADCEVLKYAMKDIPAFKEEEEYMLAASNFISRLDFELSEYHKFDGSKENYTKSWKDVDKEFRYDKDIGRQLTKKGFFEKNVPESLLTSGEPLSRAKNIYAFVKDHFTWNGKFGIYRDIRVKEAFDEKQGNIGEINISLINLLNAAGIETNMMLLSTRENGLPKKTHPVMSDFNYIVAKTTIDGKDYLLDATDKLNAFGMMPFRCLNYYGRVMDFSNDSYWFDIIPEDKNRHLVRAQVNFNTEAQIIQGIFDEYNTGYESYYKRKVLSDTSEDGYIKDVEKSLGSDFAVTSYEILTDRSDEKSLSERFKFEIEDVVQGDQIYFNPFFIKFFTRNPFQLAERNYPIDFGFKRNYGYEVNILIPEGYELKELPEKKAVNFNDNMGILNFDHQASNDRILLSFNLQLNTTFFGPENYKALQELFNYVVELQKNSLIVLKKKTS